MKYSSLPLLTRCAKAVIAGLGDFDDELPSTGGTVAVTRLNGIVVAGVIVLQVTPGGRQGVHTRVDKSTCS